jgi:hypothetical protein
MVRMTSFDADLVHRWFDRVLDEPVMPHWGIVPTEQERFALSQGASRVEAAVLNDQLPSALAAEPLTELPALMVLRYLDALAAGIASTRLAFRGVDGAGDPALGGIADGDVGAFALVAGLNAGAAALHGEIAASSYRLGRVGAEPTAAESARLAGVAAAELVVNGAGLHDVAGTAAGVAMNGWQIGLPDDPVERIEYRARGLVGLVLVALEQQTRDPEPPGEPASCGALPGENLGRPFPAEITFTMGLAPAEIRSLTVDLTGLTAEVTVWPGSQWPRFHVHTDRAGDVIGQVYAYGTPFDLLITERDRLA